MFYVYRLVCSKQNVHIHYFSKMYTLNKIQAREILNSHEGKKSFPDLIHTDELGLKKLCLCVMGARKIYI